MRKLFSRFLGVLFAGGWAGMAVGEDGDFRLPVEGGREVIRSDASSPGLRNRFYQKYGRDAAVVFWDEKLDTPRFISPRGRIPIVRPEAPEAELIEAARTFVDANRSFFGVGGQDLLNPSVKRIRRHVLVGFSQGVAGIEVRGANVRVLIGPEGQLASVDAFLLRDPALPAAKYLGDEEMAERAKELTGLEIGAVERQVIFPAPHAGTACFGFCLEAWGPEEGDASKVFFTDQGEPLGQVDASHSFCKGSAFVRGFSPNPEDIFSTADKADDLYVVPSAEVFTMTWNGLSDQSGNAEFCSHSDSDLVWSDLVLSVPVGQQNPCPTAADPPNQSRRVAEIFHKNSPAFQGPKVVSLFDAQKRVAVCDKPIPLIFNDGIHDPARAFHLLVYHHVRKLHNEWTNRMANLRLQAVEVGAVTLRVDIEDALERTEVKYTPPSKDKPQPRINIGPITSNRKGVLSWVPPTVVHHEYAHHVIYSVVATGQNDGFVEGVADAITACLNADPRIGFVGEEVRGSLGFKVDDLLRLDELSDLNADQTADLRLRRLIGRTFWRIFASARRTGEAEKVLDLFYFWMSLRQTANPGQIAFDRSKVLLEQLLVADDSLDFEGGEGDGNIFNGTPRKRHIVAGFEDQEWGLFGNAFIRGDVDRNGIVDLSDPINQLSFLFLGSGDGDRCPVAMDVDDNEVLDLSDPINLLGYLFLGQGQPPSPFPVCGADPTEGIFWCLEEPSVCR